MFKTWESIYVCMEFGLKKEKPTHMWVCEVFVWVFFGGTVVLKLAKYALLMGLEVGVFPIGNLSMCDLGAMTRILHIICVEIMFN